MTGWLGPMRAAELLHGAGPRPRPCPSLDPHEEHDHPWQEILDGARVTVHRPCPGVKAA